MRQDLRVRPVQILDDDQGRAASAGVRRDCRRHCAFAAIARGVVHRVIERPPFAELRQIKKIIEEDQLLPGDDLLIDQTLDGLAPLLGRGGRREIKQALQQAANRVLTPADAEIEHQAPMRPKSPRLGEGPHLLDQSRLADAGLATHIDDMAGAPAERGLEDALELVEFGFAADEHASVRRRRGVARNAAQPPSSDRRIDPLELKFSDRLANAEAAERVKHALGQQCLTGSRGGDQSRCEIHESPRTV